jgi:hypothetical protein
MRTRRQALLELLGLLRVLENQGVEVLLASDLELDVSDLLVLLDPGGCWSIVRNIVHLFFSIGFHLSIGWCDIQEASFRRQISMN